MKNNRDHQETEPRNVFQKLWMSKHRWLYILAASFIFLLAFSFIIHSFVIPGIIQSNLDARVQEKIQGKASTADITFFRITKIDSESVEVSASLSVTSTGSSLSPHLGLINSRLSTTLPDGQTLELATTKGKKEAGVLTSPAVLDLSCTVSIDATNQQNIDTFLSQVGIKEWKNMPFTIDFDVPVRMFGILIYSGLPLSITVTPADIKSTQSTEIISQVQDDMIKLSDTLSIVWNSQTVSLRDQGFQLISEFEFMNPSVLSISEFTGTDGYISVFGSNVLHYSFENISLVEGYQHATWIFNLDFIDGWIDTPNSVEALEKYVETSSASLVLHGPLRLKDSVFVEKATPNLNISMADLLSDSATVSNFHSDFIQAINMLSSAQTIAKIVLDSKILTLIKGQTVVVDMDLVIPLSLAIPSITLPFDTSFMLGDSRSQKLAAVKITKPILRRAGSSLSLLLAIEVTPERGLYTIPALTKMLVQYLTTKSTQISISGLDFIGEKEYAFVTTVLKPAVFKYKVEAGVFSEIVKKIVQGIVEKLPLIRVF